MREIEKRIAKTTELTDEQADIMARVDESEEIRDALRKATVADVLVELLECLKAGDSLTEAIGTIHENF